jgi:hypothetical protein
MGGEKNMWSDREAADHEIEKVLEWVFTWDSW